MGTGTETKMDARSDNNRMETIYCGEPELMTQTSTFLFKKHFGPSYNMI